ncbi:hypothetical protein II906_09825, partial [bacterium]|nr:hypothetical protein [bacterium]
MSVTITSKNNSKTFDNENIINIGTLPTCHYKLDLNFEFIVSLQLSDNGKWQVVNNLKSDKVLFRGNPIGNGIIIGSLCKLMIAGTDEFISVKITEAGTNPKVVAGSL